MAAVAVIGIGNRHGDERDGREATSSRTELAAVPVPQGETVLPETMRCPSGLKAVLHTPAVWPVSGAPRGWPVSASHSRSV
jgi:hypothetical protein